MGDLTRLIATLRNLRRMWLPLLIGFFVLLYAGLGLVYFQQQRTQQTLDWEMASKTTILSNPVQISEKLQADYEATQQAIPSGAAEEEIIHKVVAVAERHGFNVDPNTSAIDIAPNKVRTEKVGDSQYRAFSFSITGVKGGFEQVMSFISGLYTEPGLETLVLEKVVINRKGDEAALTILDFVVYARPKAGKGGG